MSEQQWEEAIRTLADFSKYPHIPRALIKNLELCVAKGRSNRATEAIEAYPLEVSERINRMFRTASQATGLDADELLLRTDFNYRDTDPTRVEAAFAEIRAINFLKVEGFVDIQPLRAASRRRADIIAIRRGWHYAVEVANSIYNATGRYTSEQLRDWFLNRLIDQKKYEQLQTTARELDNGRQVFIGVVDTQYPVVLQDREAFLEAAERVWQHVGQDPTLHIAVVTGMVTAKGLDDCVFPSWT